MYYSVEKFLEFTVDGCNKGCPSYRGIVHDVHNRTKLM